MILYNIVKEQIEVRQKRRLQKAEERGRAEGIVAGRAEGKAHAQREWREWLERKEAAEAAGEPFNESPPD